MAKKRTTYVKAKSSTRGVSHQDLFVVSAYTLNRIPDEADVLYDFPGNINLEGYFYQPFHEVTLKELDDELQFARTKRINFDPESASLQLLPDYNYYNPEMGLFSAKDLYLITVTSPAAYDFIAGMPFCIYDVQEDITYRGYLSGATGNQITIATEAEIDADGLMGGGEGNTSKKSRYIISLLGENAPEYAEFMPGTQKLIWRGPKRMRDLDSESPIYNMPFANGRLYIHKNIDMFVRRQDPHNDYLLFNQSPKNPLKQFKVEGDAKLDFDYIKYIIDSMVDAC